ncbi:RNA 2',3'-cyclic phosphodiesterase [archaeon]|nr:RNA 2',3'-cyclic phosphodiesterase [archaeon]|tara:strand:+ start:4999 stop:5526 length:528 start_codon:yes stop_codon:yes gene_type:complete
MRCFIAIDLNDMLKNKIRVLTHSLEQINDGSLKIVKGHYHVTLAFLGEISDEKAEQIKQGLESLDSGRFEIELKNVGVFKHKGKVRTIWVACRGIPRLVTKQIDDITGEQRKKPFQAHITIARVKKKPPESINTWLLEHKDYEIGKEDVKKIVLKRSKLQSYGAQHTAMFEKHLN